MDPTNQPVQTPPPNIPPNLPHISHWKKVLILSIAATMLIAAIITGYQYYQSTNPVSKNIPQLTEVKKEPKESVSFTQGQVEGITSSSLKIKNALNQTEEILLSLPTQIKIISTEITKASSPSAKPKQGTGLTQPSFTTQPLEGKISDLKINDAVNVLIYKSGEETIRQEITIIR